MIELTSVNQQYGGTQILWDLNLKIKKGSRTCIMGRNGVGKTTLLKSIMGLLPISSGSLVINDVDVVKRCRNTTGNWSRLCTTRA